MEPAAPTMREVSVGSIILRMKFMVLEEANLMKVKMKIIMYTFDIHKQDLEIKYIGQ